jgi:hypothetical protein
MRLDGLAPTSKITQQNSLKTKHKKSIRNTTSLRLKETLLLVFVTDAFSRAKRKHLAFV